MLTLKKVTTKSGAIAEVASPGVLCVVGGNNVGKSQLLREILSILDVHANPTVILARAEYDVDLTLDNAESWFRANSAIVRKGAGHETFSSMSGVGRTLQMREIVDLVQSRSWEPFWGWLIRELDSGNRSGLAAGAIESIQTGFGPVPPLAMLYRDGVKEEQLSDICFRTFGFPLTLDRTNGVIRLRVGTPEMESPPLQRPTVEYSDAVAALPPLEYEGDGVRNYLGMVLHMMTSSAGVTIIDEPEAFLHPAQARVLGQHLGDVVKAEGRQLLTATHDRDFVLGLLASDVPVTFLRLGRDGTRSYSRTLDSASVKHIWDRPELRYSNVLQGLFHRVAVVCEADADCRWYAAVLDAAAADLRAPSEEVLFLPAGGKSGAQNCVSALDAIGVDCFVVLDFDVLLDPDQLKIRLLASFSVDSTDGRIIELARMIKHDLDAEGRSRAKAYGVAGLSRGTKQQMAQDVIQLLAQRRVLVVDVGEMESFHGAGGGKGAAWVTRALEQGVHKTCAPAVRLLHPVIDLLLRNRDPATESEAGR